MPIKYKHGCRSCDLSRGDPKLRLRIYNAYYDREQFGESIPTIAEEQGLNTAALYNHAKKHVSIKPITTPLRVERSVEKLKAAIAKQAELSVDHEAIVPLKDYESALTTIIAEGMEELKKSGKGVSVSQLIAAAKIKGDFDTKKRGQDTELLKTMMRSASGYQENRVTAEPTEVD